MIRKIPLILAKLIIIMVPVSTGAQSTLTNACTFALNDEMAPCDGSSPPQAPLEKPFTFLLQRLLSDGTKQCLYQNFGPNQPEEYHEWLINSVQCSFLDIPQCIDVTTTIYRVRNNENLTWIDESHGHGQATTLPSIRDLHIDVGENSLLVTWKNPGGLCPDTHYTLHYSGMSYKTYKLHAGEQQLPINENNGFKIINVLEDTDYRICVTAVSELADNSKLCKMFLANELVPRAPVNLTVQEVTSTSALVTWKPFEDKNSSVKYVISWCRCEHRLISENLSAKNKVSNCISNRTSSLLESGHNYTYNISGLSHGVKYCVSLQALNFLGMGIAAETEFWTEKVVDMEPKTSFFLTCVAVLSPLVLLAVLLCCLQWLCSARERKAVPHNLRRHSSGSYSSIGVEGRLGEQLPAGDGTIPMTPEGEE